MKGDTLSVVVSSERSLRSQPALYVGVFADAPTAPSARIGLGNLDRVELRRSDERTLTISRIDGAEVAELGLADARLSQRHARLVRIGGAWWYEDLDSKNGSWMKGHRLTSRQLIDRDVIVAGHTALIYRAHGGEARSVTSASPCTLPGFCSMSPVLAARFDDLVTAADSAIAIEVTGETGTGKDLIARGIHTLSKRRGRFVAVNCGALASSLLESELFGHRKGAFTGAVDERPGLIRAADGGTLFLDEIAELPPGSQAALLRVLQEGEVTPLGADRSVHVDLRIVTATHQDLDEAVVAGRFRGDLRARLLGFHLEIPPLRDRPEDIGLLIAELLRRSEAAQPFGSTMAFFIDTVAALYAYDWPLNIRELERALSAASVFARGRIELSHLPAAVGSALDGDRVIDESALSSSDKELRDRLSALLAHHGGNLAEIARELKKDRTQIRRWMKRFGLRREAGDPAARAR